MSEALLRGLHNFFASDVAEDEKVRERIAAEAVAAMNAARDFARGEESRNGLPVLVENARFLIDLEAAHRVMDRNRDGHAVVGRLVDGPADHGLRHGERGVGLELRGFVVDRDRLFETLGADARGLREFRERIGAEGVAVRDGAFDMFRTARGCRERCRRGGRFHRQSGDRAC